MISADRSLRSADFFVLVHYEGKPENVRAKTEVGGTYWLLLTLFDEGAFGIPKRKNRMNLSREPRISPSAT